MSSNCWAPLYLCCFSSVGAPEIHLERPVSHCCAISLYARITLYLHGAAYSPDYGPSSSGVCTQLEIRTLRYCDCGSARIRRSRYSSSSHLDVLVCSRDFPNSFVCISLRRDEERGAMDAFPPGDSHFVFCTTRRRHCQGPSPSAHCLQPEQSGLYQPPAVSISRRVPGPCKPHSSCFLSALKFHFPVPTGPSTCHMCLTRPLVAWYYLGGNPSRSSLCPITCSYLFFTLRCSFPLISRSCSLSALAHSGKG